MAWEIFKGASAISGLGPEYEDDVQVSPVAQPNVVRGSFLNVKLQQKGSGKRECCVCEEKEVH